MDEFTVRFDENVDIELSEVDIGTAGGVLAFDLTGVIRGLTDQELERVSEKELVPTSIRFDVRDPE